MPPFDGDTPGTGVSGYKLPARLTGELIPTRPKPIWPGILRYSIELTLFEYVELRNKHSVYLLLKQIRFWSNPEDYGGQRRRWHRPGWCTASLATIAENEYVCRSERTMERALAIARKANLLIEEPAQNRTGEATDKKLSERGYAWLNNGGKPCWVRRYQNRHVPSKPTKGRGETDNQSPQSQQLDDQSRQNGGQKELNSLTHGCETKKKRHRASKPDDQTTHQKKQSTQVSASSRTEPKQATPRRENLQPSLTNPTLDDVLDFLRPQIAPGSLQDIAVAYLGTDEQGTPIFSIRLAGYLQGLLRRLIPQVDFKLPVVPEPMLPEPDRIPEPPAPELVDLENDPDRAVLLNLLEAETSGKPVQKHEADPEQVPAEVQMHQRACHTQAPVTIAQDQQSQGRVLNPDGTIDYERARRLLKQLGKLPQQRRQAGPTGLDSNEMRSALTPREARG